ncbi:MAG: U32 family peptidase [Burkholderiales bacterium]|nr:U32 family peptidase [Burkholderiales bacterium]
MTSGGHRADTAPVAAGATGPYPALRLALGPLAYYWPHAEVHAFYEAVAAFPVDVVYLGEVVCGKRHELGFSDWMAIGRRLAQSGKEVVLSGLSLPESETDLRVLRRLVGNGAFAVEANDMSMVRLAAEAKVPFVIGPHVNAYNLATLGLLHDAGAVRWVMPIDLGADALRAMLPLPLPVELFAFGRLPLAWSARCFTARARDRAKDDCGFTCRDDPDGLALATLDGESLFVLNGIQTQSARPSSLAGVIDEAAALGVAMLRIMPQAQHTADIVRAFRDGIDGRIAPGEAARTLETLTGATRAGNWRGMAGVGPRAETRG